MLYQAHTQNEQAVSGSNTGNRKPEIQAAMADWKALAFGFSELGGATEKRLEAGYTIKEIHADLPELANNISYSSVLRNLSKMGMSEKKVHLHKIEKLESQDMIPTSNEKMKMTNAERNTEKLKTKKPVFSYDPHTKGKDFI